MKNIVFGSGSYYQLKREALEEAGSTILLIDNNSQNWGNVIDGVKVDSPSSIFKYNYDKIIIMTGKNNFQILQQLLKLGVKAEKIDFGFNYYPFTFWEQNFVDGNKKKICINEYGDIIYQNNGIFIKLNTEDELNNLHDVFGKECYNYYSGSDKDEEIIIDIGMNIAGATIYFANRKNVYKVFSFEPFKNTYEIAVSNIKRNSEISEKISCFNYGLSGKDVKKVLEVNPGMSCGQSTIEEINNYSISKYEGWKLIDKQKTIAEEICLKDSAVVIENILTECSGKKIVLKVDCEGAEYDIFERLDSCDILRKIDIILLEWHYKGKESLENILVKNHFAFCATNEENSMGMIYAFNIQK